MRPPDQVQFPYEKVGKTSIRSDRRAFRLLARVLGNRTRRALRLAGATPAQLLRHCARIIKNQFRARSSRDRLFLSTDGDLCRRVHGGYKVFDLHSMIVTKIFSEDVPDDARRTEIEGIRAASELSFAPEFQGTGEELASVSESLVIGALGPTSRLAEQGRFIPEFTKQFVPIFTEMLNLWPARKVEIGVRVEQINLQLQEAKFAERFPSGICFIDSILSSLDTTRDVTVFTAFSHGDFGLVNVVEDSRRLFVIDWESASYRTVLNDFFNSLFVECYYARVTLGEMNCALDSMVDALAENLGSSAGLAESIRLHAVVYRKLYYLERLALLLGRAPSESATRVIERSIGLFEDFERGSEIPAGFSELMPSAETAREES